MTNTKNTNQNSGEIFKFFFYEDYAAAIKEYPTMLKPITTKAQRNDKNGD